MIVKAGDTHDVSWRANADLTGATVRVIASRSGSAPIVLPAEVTDGPEGLVTHRLDGTLPAATYDVELEANIAGEIVTFPNDGYVQLTVLSDLA